MENLKTNQSRSSKYATYGCHGCTATWHTICAVFAVLTRLLQKWMMCLLFCPIPTLNLLWVKNKRPLFFALAIKQLNPVKKKRKRKKKALLRVKNCISVSPLKKSEVFVDRQTVSFILLVSFMCPRFLIGGFHLQSLQMSLAKQRVFWLTWLWSANNTNWAQHAK